MEFQTDRVAAYNKGLALEPLSPCDVDGRLFRAFEAREAARNWRGALSEHAHTSFYGVDHIQTMRAYWLGLWRGLSRSA